MPNSVPSLPGDAAISATCSPWKTSSPPFSSTIRIWAPLPFQFMEQEEEMWKRAGGQRWPMRWLPANLLHEVNNVAVGLMDRPTVELVLGATALGTVVGLE